MKELLAAFKPNASLSILEMAQIKWTYAARDAANVDIDTDTATDADEDEDLAEYSALDIKDQWQREALSKRHSTSKASSQSWHSLQRTGKLSSVLDLFAGGHSRMSNVPSPMLCRQDMQGLQTPQPLMYGVPEKISGKCI